MNEERADSNEARRAERAARRAEWRRRFRAKLEEHGLGDLGDLGELGQLGDFFGDEGPTRKELQQRVDDMQRTIQAMGERIKVLERIAVQDEARLAAEIEKLRGAGGNG